VSDDKIGSRTVADGVAPNGNSGSLTVILGWFANLFKTITGETTWKTVPILNLKTAKTKITESAPPGQIAYFARSTAPPGWLKANGALVSRTAYADLFAAIGTTFGTGDGSSTFQLPDLRGQFIRVWDEGRGIDQGRSYGSNQNDELRSHAHKYFAFRYDSGPRPDISGNSQGYTANGYSEYFWGPNWPGESYGGTETRPRNVALLACIKY
jgi:hypothetical protein